MVVNIMLNMEMGQIVIWQPEHGECTDMLWVSFQDDWENPIAVFPTPHKPEKHTPAGECMSWIIDHITDGDNHTQQDLSKIRRMLDIICEPLE